MDIKERFALVIKTMGLNYSSFANKIGSNPQTVKNIAEGRNKPSYDIIASVGRTFVEINLTWLILGEGEMLLSEGAKIQAKNDTDSDYFRRQLDECNKNLTYFRERVVALEDRGRGAGNAVAVPSQQ